VDCFTEIVNFLSLGIKPVYVFEWKTTISKNRQKLSVENKLKKMPQ
jgi:hypothetical protein